MLDYLFRRRQRQLLQVSSGPPLDAPVVTDPPVRMVEHRPVRRATAALLATLTFFTANPRPEAEPPPSPVSISQPTPYRDAPFNALPYACPPCRLEDTPQPTLPTVLPPTYRDGPQWSFNGPPTPDDVFPTQRTWLPERLPRQQLGVLQQWPSRPQIEESPAPTRGLVLEIPRNRRGGQTLTVPPPLDTAGEPSLGELLEAPKRKNAPLTWSSAVPLDAVVGTDPVRNPILESGRPRRPVLSWVSTLPLDIVVASEPVRPIAFDRVRVGVQAQTWSDGPPLDLSPDPVRAGIFDVPKRQRLPLTWVNTPLLDLAEQPSRGVILDRGRVLRVDLNLFVSVPLDTAGTPVSSTIGVPIRARKELSWTATLPLDVVVVLDPVQTIAWDLPAERRAVTGWSAALPLESGERPLSQPLAIPVRKQTTLTWIGQLPLDSIQEPVRPVVWEQARRKQRELTWIGQLPLDVVVALEPVRAPLFERVRVGVPNQTWTNTPPLSDPLPAPSAITQPSLPRPRLVEIVSKTVLDDPLPARPQLHEPLKKRRGLTEIGGRLTADDRPVPSFVALPPARRDGRLLYQVHVIAPRESVILPADPPPAVLWPLPRGWRVTTAARILPELTGSGLMESVNVVPGMTLIERGMAHQWTEVDRVHVREFTVIVPLPTKG